MTTHRLTIAIFEGDGIGPEIMAPTLILIRKALERERASIALDFEHLPAGATH